MHSYKKLLQEGIEKLEEAQIPDATYDARQLLFHVTNLTYDRYLSCMMDEVPEEQCAAFYDAIEQRKKRIPLQHIIGSQNFMGYEFKVNSDVLIPRQDTETLVLLAEEQLKRFSSEQINRLEDCDRDGNGVDRRVSVLDLCTGSGCVGLALACRARDIAGSVPVQVTLADLSERALVVAEENAKNLEIPVELIHSDLFQEIDKNFDMIVSNPPYIPTEVIRGLMPEVRDHDPHMALDGGDDGLYIYKQLIPEAFRRLPLGGALLLEIGFDQGESVSNLMKDAGFIEVCVHKDLAGNDRVVCGIRG